VTDTTRNDPGHRELRELLGPFVLGHLGETEAGRVRAHLDGCASCRAEYAEIAPLAHDLRLVDPDVFDTAERQPGPLVVGRIERQVGLERTARRRRSLLNRVAVAAAVLAMLTGSGLAGYAIGRPDPAPRPNLEAVSVAARTPGVTARADLIAHTWGLEIQLTATGLDAGAGYRMLVTGTDGTEHDAGGLLGTGSRTMRCNLNADVLRSDVRSFTLRDTEGRAVLTAAI
jgi:hypothetical protein